MNLSEFLNGPRPLWMRDALCREYPDLTWFPASTVLADYEPPKAVCHRCLVRAECLEYALECKIDYGVWGGMTAPDRRHVLAERFGRPVRRRIRRDRLARTDLSRLDQAQPGDDSLLTPAQYVEHAAPVANGGLSDAAS